MGVDLAWWLARTSNPLAGSDPVRGGFDSHTLPPYIDSNATYSGVFLF